MLINTVSMYSTKGNTSVTVDDIRIEMTESMRKYQTNDLLRTELYLAVHIVKPFSHFLLQMTLLRQSIVELVALAGHLVQFTLHMFVARSKTIVFGPEFHLNEQVSIDHRQI